MKTLLIILGISLFGTRGAALPEENCCGHGSHHHGLPGLTEIYPCFEASLREQGNTEILDATSIRVIQVEEEADLGFDPAPYLPEGFDAYAGKTATWVDLGLIAIEEALDPDLGFDTAPYLPAGFDPYQGKAVKADAQTSILTK
jgi:hypothetical protein